MERLQKVLARAGLGSRRACEELITQGRVTIDGAVVSQLGTRVDPERSSLACDGRPLRLPRSVYYMLHKPRGIVCTNRDPQGRKTVLDLLPGVRERVYPVGRLDEDSEGLLLLTNDGALCNLLTHPRYGVEKTYHVVARGWIEARALERVEKGVWLAEGRTAGARVRLKKRARDVSVLEVTLGEGMNREVRRVFARVGHPVVRLKRIRVGPLELGSLAPGASRPLGAAEVEALRRSVARPERREGAGGFNASNARPWKGPPRGRASRERAAPATTGILEKEADDDRS